MQLIALGGESDIKRRLIACRSKLAYQRCETGQILKFGGVLRSVGFTLLKEKVRWGETSCMQFGDQIFDPVEMGGSKVGHGCPPNCDRHDDRAFEFSGLYKNISKPRYERRAAAVSAK